jgi:integrase
LQIELTESVLIGSLVRSAQKMKRLQSQGVALAINDFGTGYSCIMYLPELPTILAHCALRRAELAHLDLGRIQQRDGRWVIADLVGKRGRVRTVPVPMNVNAAIDEWTSAASITSGYLLRRINMGGRVLAGPLSGWAVWSVVVACARSIGIESFGAHDLRRTAARLCQKSGGDLGQIKQMLGHASILTTDLYLGSGQELGVAVNDNLGI